MWALLAAIVGFIGGVVLTRLTALLQRKNWQHQECLRAYAEMFATGEETLRRYGMLFARLDNLNALVGNSTLKEMASKNPGFQSDYDMIEATHRELRSTHDAKFRSAMDQCWLLERNQELRTRIEKFGEDYEACKRGLLWRYGQLHDTGKTDYQKRAEQSLHPDQLSTALKQLRKAVAAEHFHDKDETEKA